MGHQMNKFEQASSDDHQMSLARGPCVQCLGEWPGQGQGRVQAMYLSTYRVTKQKVWIVLIASIDGNSNVYHLHFEQNNNYYVTDTKMKTLPPHNFVGGFVMGKVRKIAKKGFLPD